MIFMLIKWEEDVVRIWYELVVFVYRYVFFLVNIVLVFKDKE